MGLRARVIGNAVNAYLSASQRFGGGRDVEMYFQPDDPYSYLLAQLVPGLRDKYGVNVATHPVVAPAPDANSEPDMRRRHAIRDCAELARYYDVAFPADATAPSEDAVLRAAAAVLAGADPAEIGAAMWSGDGDSLDPAPPDTMARLRAVEQRLRARGHYMGGMLRVGRRWCWGVDRLGYAERALGGEPSLLVKRPREQWPAPATATSLDYYVSFRSPYSYLSVDRTLALPVDVRIKPVLPMVMRGHKVPRAKRLYIVKDCKREADRLEIPFGRICDPLGVGIERCLAVFAYADREGKGGAFLRSAMRGIWSEAADVADDRDLRRVVERAELPWSLARDAMSDDNWRATAEANREQLYAEGMWGVPSYRLGDYRTWGQDRIWILAAKLAERGDPLTRSPP